MTTLNRLVAAVLLLLPFSIGCGGKQGPPATPPPATLTASPVAPAVPAMPVLTPLPPPVQAPAPAAASASPGTRSAPPGAAAAPTTTVPAGPAASAAPAPSPVTAEPTRPGPAPAATLPKRPRPKGKVALPAKLGTVTFDHPKHAEAMAIPCAHCHHPSRPEKILAAEQQACRECHTSPPSPPMKTSLQAAFHDPRAAAGTCLTCHRETVARGKQAPVKCMDCHKK